MNEFLRIGKMYAIILLCILGTGVLLLLSDAVWRAFYGAPS